METNLDELHQFLHQDVRDYEHTSLLKLSDLTHIQIIARCTHAWRIDEQFVSASWWLVGVTAVRGPPAPFAAKVQK